MKMSLVLTLLLSVVLGCHGAVYREIKNISVDQRTDVFREISNDSDAPSGYADLIIKAEIKTHHEGYYLLESRKSLHGKPQYPLLLNIDGQHVVWNMSGVRDDTPRYDDRGQVTPEGGKGMKYVIEKRISLPPGRHHLTVALPGDDYVKEIKISVGSETSNLLEFKPVYTSGGTGRHRNFLHGIKNLDAFLNGKEVF